MGRKTSKGGRGRSMEPNVLLLANPSASQDVLYKILEATQWHLDSMRHLQEVLRTYHDKMKNIQKARYFKNAAESSGFIHGVVSTVTLSRMAHGPGNAEFLFGLSSQEKEARYIMEDLYQYFT